MTLVCQEDEDNLALIKLIENFIYKTRTVVYFNRKEGRFCEFNYLKKF